MSNAKNSMACDRNTGRKAIAVSGSFRFWGRTCLENIGMAAGGALALLLFRELGSSAYAEDAGKAVQMAAALFPYLLAGTGMIVAMMTVIGCFQAYFSLLVSMNVTRTAVIRGIWLNQTGTILGILALMALIWKLTPGELSSLGFAMIPIFAAVLLVTSAVCIALGIAYIRWGKIGMIVAVLFFTAAGGFGGAFVAMSGKESFMEIIYASGEWLAGVSYWPIWAGSVMVYMVSGAVALITTRKLEVRI